MTYKLYTDKNETFECEMDVTNASLKNSIIRLVAESDDVSLVFNGKLENGKCLIPIKRLKGLMESNTSGILRLECIVDDMYFTPWSSPFIVEEHTSVKVKVNEQKESKKPTVSVKISQPLKPKTDSENLIEILHEQKINKDNMKANYSKMTKVIDSYFNKNQIDNDDIKSKVLREVVKGL